MVHRHVLWRVPCRGNYGDAKSPDYAGASRGQTIAGLLFFTPFVIVGAVPIVGAVGLYMGRYLVPEAVSAPRPSQDPEGAYCPTFCSFGTVGIQPKPPMYSLQGSSRRNMKRALHSEWPAGWRRYDRIVQADAVVVG